jgi:hypothetical protein
VTDRDANFELTENDAVDAARAAYGRRLRQPRIVVALLLLYTGIIASLAFLLGKQILVELLIAALIAPPIAFAIIGRILVPGMARTNFRQSATLKGPMHVRWDEAGFSIEQQRGSVRLAWTELAGIRESGDLILLFQSDMIYNLVSMRDFTAEQRADLQRCAGIDS